MSIKRYLFLLIGGIVLGVAAIQLLLIGLFKQHLNDEIVQKSQQLSTQIIDVALKTIDTDNQGFAIYTDKSYQGSHSDSQSRHMAVIKIQQPHANTKPHAEISPEDQVEHEKQMRQQWTKELHQIIEQKHQNQRKVRQFITASGEQTVIIGSPGPALHANQSTAIESLINYMIYLILASAVVALFLALWLSEHFTRPLQKLSAGFVSLEKGEFGVQVTEAGINDYRKTIHSFNQMSDRLAQLAESEKMLQQQSHLAELGEVSRGLAHALRNPMHTIGLAVEQLKDPSLPDPLKVKLQDKIQAKIKHIDKTIKALLTLTTGEIHRDDDVPLRSVIQDVMLELKANDPNVNINLNAPDNLNIKGSESEIRAIIHTLVVNGVEASNHQTQVTITMSDNADTVTIAVCDQGKGIEPALAERLFQPHVSSKAEGAGMGLYISNRLATLYYKGSISLIDNPDKGCTATVTLSKTTKAKANK
ncbi:MAG: signal transduction histidine kinase [Phenylobacterium sp.]|jgi:signal transduction histidine kinase